MLASDVDQAMPIAMQIAAIGFRFAFGMIRDGL
jgi:hypothetical protein